MDAPLISIIVIGYKMPRQLHNTLLSLTSDYQINIAASEYEVIVVENNSDAPLSTDSIANTYGSNFHYFLREESGVSPVNAINFAFQQCRGQLIGLLIDGARMLSPGVLYNAKIAYGISPHALVAIPGYHIGQNEHHLAEANYSADHEQAMLNDLGWYKDGYELFNVATFSGANSRGFFQPMMECNCLFSSLHNFKRIDQADSRFTLPGGGALNLHIYRSLGLLPETELFVLPGEGSFHQFHGGVTTSSNDTRSKNIKIFNQQLNSIWDNQFHSLRINPITLGKIDSRAQRFVQQSSKWAEKRSRRIGQSPHNLWPDEQNQ